MSEQLKATHRQTRLHNSRLVLKTIYDRGTTSRAEIARKTGLTRPTVSAVVTDLLARGLVQEAGRGPSIGGKPPVLLQVMDDSRQLIGIDLASDDFRGAVVNLRGAIQHRAHIPLRGRDGKMALALVYRLIDDLLPEANGTLLGIGIGTPGLMDPNNGVIRQAVNLNWQDLALSSLLQERYSLPVYVANDCQVAALAEYSFGKGKDAENLIVIKVEHGIGAGIVLNGRLFYGDTFDAGEIGHITVVEDGEPCRCGKRGCLETVASGRAIVQYARAIASDKPGSSLNQFAATPEDISLSTICQALDAGDQAARQIVVEAGRTLGTVVANLGNTLSIRQILIAGSVTCLGQPWLDAIREEINSRSLASRGNETQIETSDMGADIVILGASALVLTHELRLLGP